MEEFKNRAAVIVDSGSACCRAGLAGEENPRCCIPALVAAARRQHENGGNDQHFVVGQAAAAQGHRLGRAGTVRSPSWRGVTTDWQALEVLWHHVFYKQLKMAPEDQAVFVTDSPFDPTTCREKVCELLFEQFGVPALFVGHAPTLALYASGCISGLVLELGHGGSRVTAVHEGWTLARPGIRVDTGGYDLTAYMATLLSAAGNHFGAHLWHVVRNIKEQCCYVALDAKAETARRKADLLIEYKLPDGKVITLGNERFWCPELLFQPSLRGLSDPGISAMISDCLARAPQGTRPSLTNKVLLIGGGASLPGLIARLQSELKNLASAGQLVPPGTVVCIPSTQMLTVWRGASIVAATEPFQECWLTHDTYKEMGSFAVHHYCY
uniref:Uncharacterized protein n=1 Tax=Eptatretus burgeri TaxID=7764 RepID=A0A8C4R127_EPTBU